MLVLDTDHLSEIERGSPSGRSLALRLKSAAPDVTTTIVSAEEQFRGWLAHVSRARDPQRQVRAYARFQLSLDNIAKLQILPFNHEAAELFARLKQRGIRIGSMDLKIASIVVAHGAILLTRNASDFARVPGLKHEDWL